MNESPPETRYLGESIIVMMVAALLLSLLLPSSITNPGAHWLPLILLSNAVLGAALVAKHHLAHSAANSLMRLSCAGTVIAVLYATLCTFAPDFYAAYRLHALTAILPIASIAWYLVPRLSKPLESISRSR